MNATKIQYSERETRLIVAWGFIVFALSLIVQWAINTTGTPRPPYIIDLLLPVILIIAGVYMLRKKIPIT